MEDLKLIGSLLPRDYMVCFATQCPQNHDCMRYLAAQFIPADVEKGVCVYPTACRNGHRRYYSQIRRVRAAKGFGDIFANVKRLNCSIVNNFFRSHHHGVKLPRLVGVTKNFDVAFLNIPTFDNVEDKLFNAE